MATTIPETGELVRLREELARERQRRVDAERETRRVTWHVLHEISRKLPLLLAWADRDCRFHFANERYAALFGQTPASIRSMTLRDFYGETIWNRIEGHVHRALAGERVEFDVNDPALEDPCLFRVTYVPGRDTAGEVAGWRGAGCCSSTMRKRRAISSPPCCPGPGRTSWQWPMPAKRWRHTSRRGSTR
jgi:PAS domain-containing protein